MAARAARKGPSCTGDTKEKGTLGIDALLLLCCCCVVLLCVVVLCVVCCVVVLLCGCVVVVVVVCAVVCCVLLLCCCCVVVVLLLNGYNILKEFLLLDGLTLAIFFVDFRRKNVYLFFTSNANCHFSSGKTVIPPKRVVDFPWERNTFRNKTMEIVEDFDGKSYNNDGKHWKSLRILRVNPFFSFFFFVYHFSPFFFFVFFFIFFNFSFFFHFLLFSIIFYHFHSFSFIFTHFLSFSFIFFHFR